MSYQFPDFLKQLKADEIEHISISFSHVIFSSLKPLLENSMKKSRYLNVFCNIFVAQYKNICIAAYISEDFRTNSNFYQKKIFKQNLDSRQCLKVFCFVFLRIKMCPAILSPSFSAIPLISPILSQYLKSLTFDMFIYSVSSIE